MALYLTSRRLDIKTDDSLIFVLNEDTALKHGLYAGDRVHICWRDVCVYGTIDITNTIVGYNEIGLYYDVWMKYGIPSNDIVTMDIVNKSESIEAIKKKILGGKLSYEEILGIMRDIATRKLSTIEITYFAGSSYAPGFDDTELYYLTKAMAETGDVLDFSYLGKKVVDKHSIGGIAAKGVTPVLVPIIACFDLVIPNTTSRAITTPAGTSDILETLMPVTLTKEQIIKVVEETNGCMVWGGGLDLAPADDVLINIERPLHIESYDKFIVSIMAKKVATGIQYFLVDLPVGKGTKIEKEEDIPLVEQQFKRIGKLFDIKVDVYVRRPKGPDGYGIGPTLEARDLLYILERHDKRPLYIEKLACDMVGNILEMTETVPKGEGAKRALEKLESGEAYKKFWEIAIAQGATQIIKSSDIGLPEFSATFEAKKSGKIISISNKLIVQCARMLGAPFVKHAGIYFEKLADDSVEQGEKLFTIYSTNRNRIDMVKNFLAENESEIVEIG